MQVQRRHINIFYFLGMAVKTIYEDTAPTLEVQRLTLQTTLNKYIQTPHNLSLILHPFKTFGRGSLMPTLPTVFG